MNAASGRPLRFFIILMGSWTTLRAVSMASGMLGSTNPALPPRPPPPLPPAMADNMPAIGAKPAAITPEDSTTASPDPAGETIFQPRAHLLAHALMVPIRKAADLPARSARGAAPSPILALAEQAGVTSKMVAPPTPAASPAIPLAPPGQPRSDRWRGSAWVLWREGGATPANAIAAGRLGGSQAGVRIDYDLTPGAPSRAAAYARFSTAMNRPASPEAAVGIAWQPARTIALSVAAERRIALGKGARDANALLIVGGFGPTPLAPALEAEAYAQAGMVGFRSRDLFVDGKFSLLSPVPRSPLRIGASISGGAQPGVERLDIGPEIQIRLPLPHVPARLSVEWRERVAGNARPLSGLAVTLGADF